MIICICSERILSIRIPFFKSIFLQPRQTRLLVGPPERRSLTFLVSSPSSSPLPTPSSYPRVPIPFTLSILCCDDQAP